MSAWSHDVVTCRLAAALATVGVHISIYSFCWLLSGDIPLCADLMFTYKPMFSLSDLLGTFS